MASTPVKPIYILDGQITPLQRDMLKGKKLLVATPCYGGLCYANYTFAMIELRSLLDRLGVPMQILYLSNESLIQRARNYLSNEFLTSTDATHLLFIDADIKFNPADVVSMMLADKGIVGAAYPKKRVDFEKVFAALKANGTLPLNYDHYAGDFVLRPKANSQIKVFELAEVKYLGTGFMMIKRETLEQLKPAVKTYQPNSMPTDKGKRYFEYFPCPIVDDELLSEDYALCDIAQKNGIDLHLAPWVYLSHMGTYEFQGCLFCSGGKIIHQHAK